VSNTLFISIARLKADSFISGNVEDKIITPVIGVCQDMYILPILGTALYNDLKSAIDSDNTLAGNALYRTLLESYIIPCLSWYVVAEVNDPNTYKMANKGLVKKNSDNSLPADVNEIIRFAAKNRDRAEWYGERLIKYLQQNQSSFPKYLNQGASAGIDTIYPKVNAYQSGLALGDVNTQQDIDYKWSYGYPWREKE
jgi:hypothetical protein